MTIFHWEIRTVCATVYFKDGGTNSEAVNLRTVRKVILISWGIWVFAALVVCCQAGERLGLLSLSPQPVYFSSDFSLFFMVTFQAKCSFKCFLAIIENSVCSLLFFTTLLLFIERQREAGEHHVSTQLNCVTYCLVSWKWKLRRDIIISHTVCCKHPLLGWTLLHRVDSPFKPLAASRCDSLPLLWERTRQQQQQGRQSVLSPVEDELVLSLDWSWLAPKFRACVVPLSCTVSGSVFLIGISRSC